MTLKLRTVVLLFVAIAGTLLTGTHASGVTILFTDSNQLNLTDRNILSAVNFYDASNTGGNAQQVTDTIQGVTFYNMDHGTETTVGPLTASFPHASDGRFQSGASIIGTGADQAHADELATAITYWSSTSVGSLSYDFGITQANKTVEIQLIGGDAGWTGEMDVLISGVSQGTMLGDSNSNTADLLTFETTLNPLGQVQLDLDVINGNFYGLAGAIVTSAIPVPIPEPSSFVLMLAGMCGLIARRRKRSS